MSAIVTPNVNRLPEPAGSDPADSATIMSDVTGAGITEQAQSSGPNVTSPDVTFGEATEQVEPNVTPSPLSAAERKRRQRERERNAQALFYERSDWQLFCDISTLPQKAGCQPAEIVSIALKELVDNSLDHCPDGEVALRHDADWWVIEDTGPGIDPERVPSLFCVNRPLLSSKLRRLPLRGMLGNGLRVVTGAVAATNGELVVETRGHRLELEIDRVIGLTRVLSDTAIPVRAGTVVRIKFSELHWNSAHGSHARIALSVARHGRSYAGPSSPHWYGPRDLLRLFSHVTPPDATVADVCRDLGFIVADDRIARTLSLSDATEVLNKLQDDYQPVPANQLGFIGPDAYDACYCRREGNAAISGAKIPFTVEAWAECSRAERGSGDAHVFLLLNRTSAISARLSGSSGGGRLGLSGCGLSRGADVPTGRYRVNVSLITPYVQLTGDGKSPDLTPFAAVIMECVQRACRQAHRQMDRPPEPMTIKDAASSVMRDAYLMASDNGTLPANARQVMYAARRSILELTGKSSLNDQYFTQTLLPNYVEEHPDECASWDVVFDARGTFTEPHTGKEVPIGTLEVRQYIGERPAFGRVVDLDYDPLFPTSGPQHRYRSVLFVEKEGFGPLLAKADIASRFDIAIMSTKGMSVTAARLLLDKIALHIDQVLVLHDFDVTGFSIFGTLGTDGRRYTFENHVKLIDIGLRLADVEEMGLEAERVEVTDFSKRIDTLRRHGATKEEINFLSDRRVELNAMNSRQFIDFLERKLRQHGAKKVLPDQETLERHARRVLEQIATERLIESCRTEIAADVSSYPLAGDLLAHVAAKQERNPSLPWDIALAECIREPEVPGR
jgi:hypothetical protein